LITPGREELSSPKKKIGDNMQTEHRQMYCDFIGCNPAANPAHYIAVPEPFPGIAQRIEDEVALAAGIQPQPAGATDSPELTMCETCWEMHGLARGDCAIRCRCHAVELLTELDVLCARLIKTLAVFLVRWIEENPNGAHAGTETSVVVSGLELLPHGLKFSVSASPIVAKLLNWLEAAPVTSDAPTMTIDFAPCYDIWHADDIGEATSTTGGLGSIVWRPLGYLEEFIELNKFAEQAPYIAICLRALQPGQEFQDGGGAAPVWKVRRTQ
jgi:hypothetical protein